MSEKPEEQTESRPLEEAVQAAPAPPDQAAQDFGDLHPADAADHIEELDLHDQVKFIKTLPIKDAADSIAEMDKHDQQALIPKLNTPLAARILSAMPPDDAADILEELDEELRYKLLHGFDIEDREEISSLLAFDPDTAGGAMNPNVVILDSGLNADQAIMKIRKEVDDEKEVPYYAYVVDSTDTLIGVLSMRDLLLAKPRMPLKDMIKDQQLVTVMFDTDKEEVARLIGHYNLLALPVVDHDGKLLGVVTVDDVIDIIHEEASEDMQAMVGAGADETTDSPWTYSVKKRLPWLIINVANSAVAAWVVHLFEGTIAEMAILAVLMPIVANQAGNSGQQALAVMIRQLALVKFDRRKSWLAVLRELKIGAANGLIICLLVWLAVFLLTQKPILALIMALALGFDIIVGVLAGASIPLVLKEIGRDPAQASSIFLTTVTDSVGFFSLLGLATLIM